MGVYTERENLSFGCQGIDSSGNPMENLSTNTEHRGGFIRSSDEGVCNER